MTQEKLKEANRICNEIQEYKTALDKFPDMEMAIPFKPKTAIKAFLQTRIDNLQKEFDAL